MTNSNKFGAFAGVFTPALLAILGVIMYLRFGWIVGQGGIFVTLVIIILAHLISVTTGLSISSIATDKKIKTGGVYYLLSRSLGFPMGGAIGLTLYVGTSLLIALHIVGFCENFLSIESLSQFLNLQPNLDGYRILGSIVLALLVIIAFISTSLAIKTQYFILAAILLSFISIGVGIALDASLPIESTTLTPTEGNISFITLFAIFFPAVTGFTAGVAMSGDLKDPKASVPKGTLAAIGVGLLIYLVLTLVFGFFVDRNLLLTDSNFLMKVALWSPLVIAGIWGATLSSALGGLLSGPRIIQAVAMDKIVPSFLARGRKGNNEPRNALLFTFLLAEVGILIGELNVIAEIVAMFYIAAYGFINLAFTLESWASSDFRPSFKVPRWVGIVGFVACFGIMSQINFLAMITALLVIASVYFYLMRKELKSEAGDVWGSVWLTLVRVSLKKLHKRQIEERNWKPNILLFNVDETQKEPQLHVGKAFAGKYGFLSVFRLTESNEGSVFYSKRQQNIVSDNANNHATSAIFERQQSVKSIYEGIIQISSIHGFSGIEPNTVMLGWGRNTKDPKTFAHLLKNLYQLDMNIVMMDYDTERKFGKKANIDIWWIGEGQNGNLALQLVKFLWLDESWRQAKLRLLIINPVNAERDILLKRSQDILSEMRIQAEVKVINNQIEKRSFYEIVQTESVHSDLIFMGIPEFNDGEEVEFIQKTNDLCHNIGTVILIKASTFFKSLKIGIARKTVPLTLPRVQLTEERKQLLEHNNPSVRRLLNDINTKLEPFAQNYIQRLEAVEIFEDSLYEDVLKTIERSLLKISLTTGENFDRFQNQLSATENHILNELTKLYKKLISGGEDEISSIMLQQKLFEEWVMYVKDQIINVTHELPKRTTLTYSIDEIRVCKSQNSSVRWYKFRMRLLAWFGKKEFNYRLKTRKIYLQHILPQTFNDYLSSLQLIRNSHYASLIRLRSLVNKLAHSLQELKIMKPEEFNVAFVQSKLETIQQLIQQVQLQYEKQKQEKIEVNSEINTRIATILAEKIDSVHPNAQLKIRLNILSPYRKIAVPHVQVFQSLFKAKSLLINSLILNNTLLITKNRLAIETSKIKKSVALDIDTHILRKQNLISDKISLTQRNITFIDNATLQECKAVIYDRNSDRNLETAHDVIARSRRRMKLWIDTFPDELELLNEESYNNLTSNGFEKVGSLEIATKPLIDFLIQREFLEPVKEIVSAIPIQVNASNKALIELIRYVEYYIIGNRSIDTDDFESHEQSLTLDNISERLSTTIQSSQHFLQKSLYSLESTSTTVAGKLDVYPFLKAAVNIKQYIKEIEPSRRRNWFVNAFTGIQNFFRDKYSSIILSKSSGILFTRRLLAEKKHGSLTEQLLVEYRQTHIRQEVRNRLSFYYKHLFTSKQNFSLDLMVGRERQLKQMDDFMANYRSGFCSAMLITGERHSGKSFLANVFAERYFDRRHVFFIHPPEGGSTNFEVFDKAAGTAFNNSFGAEHNFSSLKTLSLVIIEDAELWWEKVYKGEETLQAILNLTSKYRNQVVFLFVSNDLAYKSIQNVMDVAGYFSSIVECVPMNASTLGKMLLTRHNLGNIPFVLNGRRQQHFRSWHYASLFNKYFLLSEGNPGLCLHMWINNIEDTDGKILNIRKPAFFDNSIFDRLSKMQRIVLLNIILHSGLTVERLERLLKINETEAINLLKGLMVLGLVTKTAANVYKTDRVSHHRLVSYFRNNNFI
jgi:amino acid transporter